MNFYNRRTFGKVTGMKVDYVSRSWCVWALSRWEMKNSPEILSLSSEGVLASVRISSTRGSTLKVELYIDGRNNLHGDWRRHGFVDGSRKAICQADTCRSHDTGPATHHLTLSVSAQNSDSIRMRFFGQWRTQHLILGVYIRWQWSIFFISHLC